MFERYAIFYTPTGGLAAFGAAWLGWDSAKGCAVPHFDVAGLDLDKVTATPRKYGLHGTLKAPFTLARGADINQVHRAAEDFSTHHNRFEVEGFALRYESGFVALRPENDPVQLRDFAAATVRAFDPFRAPLSDADIARRRKVPLSARQDRQMLEWGYPYIFDDFHFHLTLSGQLPPNEAALVMAALQPHLTPVMPKPFVVDAITLMGQNRNGMFHQIHRYALTG